MGVIGLIDVDSHNFPNLALMKLSAYHNRSRHLYSYGSQRSENKMIAIPNMSKPKSCGECEFNYCLEGGSYEWWECVILHDDINQFDTRRTDCPLIEIDLERDIPTIWYNRQTGQFEPKGTKQEVYERLYKLKNGERRSK